MMLFKHRMSTALQDKRVTNSMAKEEEKAWKPLQTRVLVFVTEERNHQPKAMPLHFPASLAK